MRVQVSPVSQVPTRPLLFDGLKEVGPEWLKKHINILSLNRSFAHIALALATLMGGVAFDWNEYSIFYLTGLSLALALTCLLFISESPRKNNFSIRDRVSFVKSLSLFLQTKKGKNLFIFIVAMAFIEALHTPVFIFQQGLLKSYGLSGSAIGLIIATELFFSSIGIYVAPKLSFLGLKTLIFVATTVVSLCAFSLAAGVSVVWVVISLILIVSCA